MARKKIPEKIQTEVLVKSRRRCALCFGLNREINAKSGQIAHIDHNNSNSELDNLVFLCFEHHDQYDSTTSQSKNFTQSELKTYRDELYNNIEQEFGMSKEFFAKAEYEPDEHNGIYRFELENKEATIEINHIKDNIYAINGTSFFGTKRKCGPNIGELSEIGTLKDNILT